MKAEIFWHLGISVGGKWVGEWTHQVCSTPLILLYEVTQAFTATFVKKVTQPWTKVTKSTRC
jgi:hypothetical protein